MVIADDAAFDADIIALDAAVAALMAAPVAAEAALAAAVVAADVSGTDGVTTTVVEDVDDAGDMADGVVAAGVTTVVSSFLLQAARATAATRTASESDLFILGILSF